MAVQTLDKVTAKPDKPPTRAQLRAAKNFLAHQKEEVKPEAPKARTRDFYADHADGDLTAGFVASHGTWQNWTSNISTPGGRRGVQETRLVPCGCDLCKNAIEKKGWTF